MLSIEDLTLCSFSHELPHHTVSFSQEWVFLLFCSYFLTLQVAFILKTIELPTLWCHYNLIIIKRRKHDLHLKTKNRPKKTKKKWENILPLLKNKKWVVEYPYICGVKRSHSHKLHKKVKIGGKIQLFIFLQFFSNMSNRVKYDSIENITLQCPFVCGYLSQSVPPFFQHDRRTATKFCKHYVDWSGNHWNLKKCVPPHPRGDFRGSKYKKSGKLHELPRKLIIICFTSPHPYTNWWGGAGGGLGREGGRDGCDDNYEVGAYGM